MTLQSAPYRQMLKEIDLESALRYFARCSIEIWSQMPPKPPPYRHHALIRGVARLSKPYNLPNLAYLAGEIIANARGTKEFDLEEFDSGIEFINSPSTITQDLNQSDSAFKGMQILLATAYPQTAIADGPRLVNRFGRHRLLYTEIGTQDGTGSMPKFVAHFSDFKEGLSINQFMLAGMMVFALALRDQGQIEIASFPNLRIGSTMIERAMLDRFLKIVSATPSIFKRKMVRKVSENWHMHTLTNPLLSYPVIRIDKNHFAPVPQLLIDRCGEGIREDFRTGLSTGQFERFSKDLGTVFQQYLQHLVEETNSLWQVWDDQPYDGLRTCDLLILDGHDLVLVECKSSPMRKQVKTWMSKSNYDQELGKIADGVEAVVRTAKHLREGRLKIEGLDVGQIQQWAGFVVTMDEYLLRPSPVRATTTNGERSMELNLFPVRDYFLRICRKKIAKSKQITWQDVQDFPEAHLQVVSADDFEQHLATTMSERARLFDLVTGQILPSVHPLLQDRFNKCLASVSMIDSG